VLINIALAFVLPWIFGTLYLHPKNRRLLPLVGTAFCILAIVINELGSYYGFWKLRTSLENEALEALPFDLGVYPVLASYMIFLIQRIGKPHFFIFLIALFTTFLEGTYVHMERVIYGNGWNLVWTFFSYWIPYGVIYLYYRYLVSLRLLH